MEVFYLQNICIYFNTHFRSIALNCNAKFNVNGAEAKDWKKGKPIRVIRNYKMSKHSKFAPTEGNR